MRTLITLSIVFQMLFGATAFAQMSDNGFGPAGDQGMGMPQSQGQPPARGQNLEGNYAYLGIEQQCPFEPAVARDDRTLLGNANRALADLANRDQCRAVAGDSQSALQREVEAYRVATGTLGPMTPFEAAQVTCANYRDLYNEQYTFYISNWNATYRGSAIDPMMECRQLQSRDAALECAEKITGELIASKGQECRTTEKSLQARAEVDTRVAAYRAAAAAFENLLSNDNCIDLNGSQASSLVQTGLSLASRLSTLGVIGSGAGPLIGLGAELLGSLVKKIFHRPGYLEKLAQEQDFTKLACLYNKLEDKAKRCDRILAASQVDRRRQSYDASAAFCQANNNLNDVNSFVDQFSGLISSLNTPPPAPVQSAPGPDGTPAAPAPVAPAPTLAMNDVMNVTRNLTENNFPGTDRPIIDVATQSADDVVAELTAATKDLDSTKAFLAAQGKTASDYQAAAERARLQQKKTAAESVKRVLDAVKGYALTGDTSESTRAAIETAMKGFDNGGSDANLNFSGAFNQIMQYRATMNGGDTDLTEKVSAFNSRLSQLQMNSGLKDTYDRLSQTSNQSTEDNSDFEQARAQVQLHLQNRIKTQFASYLNPRENEGKGVSNPLFSLRQRIANYQAKDIAPTDSDFQAKREERRELDENFIKPLLSACNQLQSARTKDTNDQFSFCQNFACPNGMKQFAFPQGYDASNCAQSSAGCFTKYRKHICEETNVANFSEMRRQISEEFINSGKVCGRTMAQILGR